MVSHILIVDADPTAAQVTSAIIARVLPEATLSVAPTAENARRSAQEHHPNALIIDPSPHSLDGARLIQQLKEDCPGARVIVLASAPTPALRRRMEELGVDAYLEKPATASRLVEELRILLVN